MKKCPWAAYLKAKKIECPLPLKVDKVDKVDKDWCRMACFYWRDEKCRFKTITAEEELEWARDSAERDPEWVKQAVSRVARDAGLNEEDPRIRELERVGLQELSKIAKDEVKWRELMKKRAEWLEEGGWWGWLKRKLGR
jgi:hypothetical protein